MKKKQYNSNADKRKSHVGKKLSGGNESTSPLKSWYAVLTIFILGIVVYSNSFKCSFHFDDILEITRNPVLKKLSIVDIWNVNHNRFVAYYSFAINYRLNQLDVWGYHFVNLMIHLINAVLVYWFVILLFKTPNYTKHKVSQHKEILACIVALLFVSHPLATQSVTYIVQRLAAMVTMFYLLSLLFYVKGRLSETRKAKMFYFIVAAITGVLATLTKENSFTLPITILLFEICFLQSDKRNVFLNKSSIVYIFSGFVLVVLVVINRFSWSIFKPVLPALGNNDIVTPGNYLLTQFSVIVKYISLLAIPVNLNLDYDYPIANSLIEPITLFSGLFLVGLLVLALYLFNKQRIISFGIFYFFTTLAIESSIIPLPDVIFEHRTYLPSVGFFLVMVWCVYLLLWDKSKSMAIALLLMLICINASLAFQRNKIWLNEFTLYNDILIKSPNKARPHAGRGDLYKDAGDYKRAIDDYDKALLISTNYAEVFNNRGISYNELNQSERAYQDFSKAIEIKNKFKDAYYNRGTVLIKMNRLQESIADFDKVLALDSLYGKAYFNRGIDYYKLGKYTNAISDFTSAINIDASNISAYNNRAATYLQLNDKNKAISDYTKIIELDPSNKIAYFTRAILYSEIGQQEQAINDYTKVIQKDARYAEAYLKRGVLYMAMNEIENAIMDFSKALEIDPTNQAAADNLKRASAKI